MSAPRARVDGEHAEIDVPLDHPRGALGLESDAARRVRVVLDGRSLAWARVLPGWRGFAWARASREEPLAIVPPIRSADARATEPGAWPGRLASWIAASDRSGLRAGTWALAPLARRGDAYFPLDRDAIPSVARGLLSALEAPSALVEPYRLNGSGRVLALRSAPRAESARVKSWRKHAREGTLPPILLSWLGALDAYVILDGHERLSAARIEAVAPEVVALFGVREDLVVWGEADRDRARSAALARYELVFRREERLSARSRDEANARLVGAYGDYAQRRSWTPATYRGDLAARFARELPADLAPEVRDVLL